MAIRIQVSEVSHNASKSLLKRRERFSQPNVHSTIQRHCRTLKPLLRGRFTIESTRWRFVDTSSTSFSIGFTEEAIAEWRPVKTGARGRPREYSDLAIETAMFIRQVFHLPLRQTEGFMNSLARVMKAGITIPDFSSIANAQHCLS